MRAVIDGHLNRTSDSTRLADRLLALGMIERRADPSDRRVVLVRLTPKGRNTYLQLTRCIQALHKEQWSALTQAELRELRRLLVKALGEDASREKLDALAAGDV
jgi:DNA-binding MarR family transcriptional regulator